MNTGDVSANLRADTAPCLETSELLEARWKRWLQHDPIRLVGQYKKNLQSLKGIYIDCGWKDQYHIHYGPSL